MFRQAILTTVTAFGLWSCASAWVVGSDPDSGSKTITNSLGMKLRLIPAGEFLMGSPETPEELARVFEAYQAKAENFDDERPPHPVRITRPFYLGAHEVTVGQFRKFVEAEAYRTEGERDGKGGYGYNATEDKLEQKPKYTWRNAGFPQTDDHPVVNVSWNDAVAFAEWLSRKDATRYRLPTEAEWEYACRAGTTTRWYHGNDEDGLAHVGNVRDATTKAKFPNWKYTIGAADGYVFTAPVGKFQANGFGLYDMHGNVWEWCADWYDAEYYGRSPSEDPPGAATGSFRVFRGGSWGDNAGGYRAANRSRNKPSDRYSYLGFRLARTVSSSAAR